MEIRPFRMWTLPTSGVFKKHYGKPLKKGAVPLTRLLSNLNLVKAGTLNLAGLLLLPSIPNDTCPHSW